jgi:hypothetical protein
VIRVRNPLNFHGSGLPAEALAQTGVPYGHGELIEDGEDNIWIYLEAARMNSIKPGKAFEKALQRRLQGSQSLNKFISLDNFI